MAYVERYISTETYASQYLVKGEPYEGFVVGYGYLYPNTIVLEPPHMRGYSRSSRPLYGDASHNIVGQQQIEDRSPEAIKLSLRGLFRDGEAKIIVAEGMTLSHIATMFDVTVDDLVEWNGIVDSNTIHVGQLIKIKSDYKPFTAMNDIAEGIDLALPFAFLYNNRPITLGSRYIRINQGGTVIRNPNLRYISTHRIANRLGKGVAGAQIGLNLLALANEEQTVAETAQNTAIIGAVYFLAKKIPYLGWALTIGDMIFTPCHPVRPLPPRDLMEPVIDNLRVVRPVPIDYYRLNEEY